MYKNGIKCKYILFPVFYYCLLPNPNSNEVIAVKLRSWHGMFLG